MVDGKGLLDALIGAVSTNGGQSNLGGLGNIVGQMLGGQPQQPGAASGGQSGLGGLGDLVGQMLGGGQGQSGATGAGQSGLGGLGDLVGQMLGGGQTSQAGGQATGGGLLDIVKGVVAKNPGLAQAVAMGAAGVLLSGKARGLASNAASLGGIALIGTLAYRALQRFQQSGTAGASALANLSGPESYTPAAVTNEGAILMVRTMVAAAMADGSLDAQEKQRIAAVIEKAGADPKTAAWFQQELHSPASAQELADTAETFEQAAEVYVAARVTIDPDTAAEKKFLKDLAGALGLDDELVAELNQSVDQVKVAA